MTVIAIQTLYQGDTCDLPFEVQDHNCAPQDLTGAIIRWALADPANLALPIVQKTIGNGITTIDAVAGRIIVTLQPVDTSGLAGTYRQELEVTLPSGATYTYAQGPIIIKPTIYPDGA